MSQPRMTHPQTAFCVPNSPSSAPHSPGCNSSLPWCNRRCPGIFLDRAVVWRQSQPFFFAVYVNLFTTVFLYSCTPLEAVCVDSLLHELMEKETTTLPVSTQGVWVCGCVCGSVSVCMSVCVLVCGYGSVFE